MQENNKQVITLVTLRNPFNLKEHDREIVDWNPTKTFAEYIPHIITDAGEVEFVASLNGKVINKEDWAKTYLTPDDNIIMCPIIGKGGKSIFKLVALIAVSIIAPQIGFQMASALEGTALGVGGGLAGSFFGSTAAFGAFLGTAVSFVGSQLVNAMFSNKSSMDGNRGSDSLAGSPTYGYDGPKNISAEGVPVPVVYGTYRSGGNLINAYVENVGNSQYIYMLYAVSEGEITGITDVYVNDQPIGNYRDVETRIRLGQPTQEMIGWFGDTNTPRQIGLKLTTEFATFNTVNEVDKLRFDVSFPGGLFAVDPEEGAMLNKSVDLQFQYRKFGDTEWITVMDYSVIDHYEHTYLVDGVVYQTLPAGYKTGAMIAANYPYNDSSMIGSISPIINYENRTPGAPPSSEPVRYDNNGASGTIIGGDAYVNRSTIYKTSSGTWPTPPAVGGSYYSYTLNPIAVGNIIYTPIYSPIMRVTSNSRTPLRRSYYTPVLPEGRYETRFRRVTPESTKLNESDLVNITEINEIIIDDVAYNNTALVGVRVLLSDQLNGLPKVTFLTIGRKIRVWRDGAWVIEHSANPAWIFLDMLTHTRYGAGLSDARFNMEKIKEWAAHCDSANLTFNGVFDTTMTLWDALQYVLRCGHAQLLMAGTIITVAIEKEESAVMMFSVANMLENTFQINWLPIADRSNEVDVTYFDKLDGYKQKVVKVADKDSIDNGLPSKVASITLFGVVDQLRAYNEGFMQLMMNKYILQTVTFDAAIDAIACTVGDVIYVQHDMPQWGFAGRTKADNTNSVINLDRPVMMEYGKQYKLLCTFDAVQRASGSISNIVGTSVYLTGYDGNPSVRRFMSAGKDLEVLSIFDAGSGTFGIVLYSAAGLSIGGAYTLYDTDVLEERDVVVENSGVEVETVTVTQPFSQVPPIYTHFMFGQNTKVKKPFRVRAISGTGDYARTITALEYNASIYAGDPNIALPTPNYSALNSATQNAVIDGTVEDLFPQGTGFGVKLTVHYHCDASSYRTSKVLVSRNGQAFVHEGTHPDYVTIVVNDGDVIVFKVVAVSTIGASVPESIAPTRTHTVIGKVKPPSDVTGFTAVVNPIDIALTWDAVKDIDLSHYEIRSGASWDSGAVLVTGLASTKFVDDKADAGIYTYHIRAVDTSGIYSANTATAQITLVAPAQVEGFDCVQNGDRIEFRWDANADTTSSIVGYEIREGASWGSSVFLTQVNATTYSTPANSIAGDRTFWIKAIAAPGIYSNVAVFSTTTVAVSNDRNIIVVDDEDGQGWLGSKFNVSVADGNLVLNAGETYGEYTWGVSLPQTYRARNSIKSTFDAVVIDGANWQTSTFQWKAPEAGRAWTIAGDLSTVNLNYYISKWVGLGGSYIEGFGLNAIASGENGTTPAQALGITYTAGRFLKGAVINDFARLNWNLAVPAVFNTTFWAIPQNIAGNQVYWSGETATGLKLIVGYDSAVGAFYLEDTLGQKVSVPYTIAVSDRILVGIVQTATERKLYVGALDGVSANAVAAFTPIGALTSVKLHQ